MNAAARVIMNVSVRDRVKPVLIKGAALATSRAKNHVQAMSTHVLDLQWTGPQYLTSFVSIVSAAASR